jgi:hypothetical protein
METLATYTSCSASINKGMKQRVTSIEITLDLEIKGDFYWLSSEEKQPIGMRREMIYLPNTFT